METVPSTILIALCKATPVPRADHSRLLPQPKLSHIMTIIRILLVVPLSLYASIFPVHSVEPVATYEPIAGFESGPRTLNGDLVLVNGNFYGTSAIGGIIDDYGLGF